MVTNILYFVLALLGLSFLIFIHELGHYFMARKVGMRIEVFSIGFGKPLYSWIFQGVKWQICYLPFGGYVQIAGEREENGAKQESFYEKTPWQRIQVALMGPIVNIVFAFILFTIIWIAGGKLEPFSKHTNIIGYVDPQSELYSRGIRPGDQITSYNHHKFQGFKDILYASVLRQPSADIEGVKIDYFSQSKEPFDYKLSVYRDPRTQGDEFKTAGILAPAHVLMFSESSKQSDFPFEDSPMKDSGLQYGDRIVWANGELIFSMQQLAKLVNEPKVLLSVQRQGKDLLVKVPRIQVADLRLKPHQKEDLEDWQHQVHRKGPIKDLFFIPYTVDVRGIVEEPLKFIGEDSEEHTIYDELDPLLRAGDKITSVDGVSVDNGYELLERLQAKQVQLIVQRGFPFGKTLTWKNENDVLIASLNSHDLNTVVEAIREKKPLRSSGDLHALQPVQPILLSDLPLSSTKKNWLLQEFIAQKERVEKILDPVLRQQALKALEKNRRKLVLGVPLQDVVVCYNPNPLTVFSQVVGETFKTLTALFTGKLNPKWMSGPVGMVQVIHHGWSMGVKEALFWIAAISLNLGVFNLLPIPVLDGGRICFFIYEWVFKKRPSPKAMEKLIIPFVVLLIGLFVYVTYQDLVRLLGKFF